MDYEYVEDSIDFEFLEDSIGKWIKVERGGPDKLEGRLLGIKSDYLIVQTKDGVVYVASEHIKTISEPILAEGEEGDDLCDPVVLEAEDFLSLLGKLKHKLVKINQHGPNSVEGVLIKQREDTVTIVHKMKEYVHYPVQHIKSVVWVINSSKDDKKGNDKDKK